MPRSGELFAGTADAISDEERQIESDIAVQRQIAWTSRWPKDRIHALKKIKELTARRAAIVSARLAAKR